MTEHSSLSRAEERERRRKRLKSPRAAGVAGILFAILFTLSLALVWIAVPEQLTGVARVDWLQGNPDAIGIAFSLLPLSGIAGVVYALQYNRKGSRQRLFDKDKAKKQLPSGG